MAAIKTEGGRSSGPIVQFIVPRDQYEIVDNWQVMGMRGTGSKRVAMKDVFVPAYNTMASARHGRGSGADPARSAGEALRQPHV